MRSPQEIPTLAPQILDIDEFIARVEPYFATSGFYEKEIARRTEQFGCMAQAWSTYESRHDPSDSEPFMRGINSIQLFHDGNRWWIVNIYWQQESSEHPIPGRYLDVARACNDLPVLGQRPAFARQPPDYDVATEGESWAGDSSAVEGGAFSRFLSRPKSIGFESTAIAPE